MMKQLLDECIQKLETELTANAHGKNPLKRISLELKAVEITWGELLRNVDFQMEYHFEERAQIEYNKYYLPPFLARLFLLKKTYLLENQKLHSTIEGSRL